MKIYTQSKSWLAKFTVDISGGIIAAIAATGPADGSAGDRACA